GLVGVADQRLRLCALRKGAHLGVEIRARATRRGTRPPVRSRIPCRIVERRILPRCAGARGGGRLRRLCGRVRWWTRTPRRSSRGEHTETALLRRLWNR